MKIFYFINMFLIFIFGCIFFLNTNAYSFDFNQKLMQTLQEEKIDKLMASSPQFQECSKNISDMDNMSTTDINNFKTCFENQMNQISDEAQLKALSDQLELTQFQLVPSDDRKHVMEYFSERIEKALYGKSFKDAKLSELKHVDHSVFLNIYETVVGKAVVMDLARYCLEDHNRGDNQSVNKYATESFQSFKDDVINGTISNQDALSTHFQSCYSKISNTGASKPCENYEPGNTDFSNITETASTANTRRACLMQHKLRSYQAVIKKIKKSKEFYKSLEGNAKITQVPNFFKGQYANGKGKGERTSYELASMTSKDILEDALDEKNQRLTKQHEDFKKNCIENYSKECENLFSENEAKALQKLKLKVQAQVTAKMKYLNVASEDSLKKIVENSNEFTKAEKQITDPAQLKALIKEKYLTKKRALIAELQDRVHRRTSRNANEHLEKLEEDLAHKKDALQQSAIYNSAASAAIKMGSENQKDDEKKYSSTQFDAEITQLQENSNDYDWLNDIEISDDSRKPSNSDEPIQDLNVENLVDGLIDGNQNEEAQAVGQTEAN